MQIKWHNRNHNNVLSWGKSVASVILSTYGILIVLINLYPDQKNKLFVQHLEFRNICSNDLMFWAPFEPQSLGKAGCCVMGLLHSPQTRCFLFITWKNGQKDTASLFQKSDPIREVCGMWDADYISDNWEPEFMTIFVTWQSRVTLDSIHNSCNVL